MAIDGRRTLIPISDVATVLDLSAPDKMRVLNAGSDIERKIYQSMSWEERDGKYYGHGILREGALILSVLRRHISSTEGAANHIYNKGMIWRQSYDPLRPI